MRQIVKDYSVIARLESSKLNAEGNSVGPKTMIFYILDDNSSNIEVLDIGFGTGSMAQIIKNDPETGHWAVDGIDGWEANCNNASLFEKKVYRNIWHGLAQDIPAERLSEYKIICLLDVIEHLPADTAKQLLRLLLTGMGEDSYLFITTPLWYYPQDGQQEGDLEEHLIGVPATSMMALLPIMYSISSPLIGGFVLRKRSLDFIDLFHPTADKNFSLKRGLAITQAVGMNREPGIITRMP